MRKVQYISYAILALILLGLVAYDYYPDKSLEQNTVSRAGLLGIALVISIIRAATNSKKDILNKKAVYSKAYPEFIGNAFSHSPKLEKEFYDAVDDYSQDKCAAGIKKLSKLRSQCQSTEDVYAVTIFQALCFDDIQLYSNAIELYNAAMQIRPNSTLASNIGLCYDKLGMLQESADCYLQAIQLDPSNPYPYNNLAQQHIRAGRYAEAADYAKQALNLNPKMPQALNAMAISSYMMGDTVSYENYYRQAVSNGSDGEALKNYIKSLDSNIE